MPRTYCHFSEELEGLLIPNSSFLLFFLSAIFRAHAGTEEKHIKNVYMKKVQALTGVKPVVKRCMELN